MDSLAGMKVADLKRELKNRGLSQVGAKNDLITRLALALSAEKPGTTVIEDSLLNEDEDLGAVLNDDDEDASDLSDPTTPTIPPDVSTSPLKSEKSPQKISQPVGEKRNGAAENNNGASSPKKQKITISRSPVVAAPAAELNDKGNEEGTSVKLASNLLTPEDKRKMRQEKFGSMATDTAASVSPAAAAKQPPTASVSKEESDEKRKMREEKFGAVTGISTTGKVSLVTEDGVKMAKRLERFGVITGPSPTDKVTSKPSTNDANSKAKRSARFAGLSGVSSPEVEEQKKKRAERFSS